MKNMLFIFNPHTGGGRLKNKLMDILCLFSAAGYTLKVCPTHAEGDARKLTRQHGEDADILVCCGGDGTLNEVVDGLMCLKNIPEVGYIPGGTTCDFAASMKLPRRNMMRAANRILTPKQLYQCDVGILNNRAFTYVAAFGAFTDVPYITPQKYKNAAGYFAYVLSGIQQLPSIQSSHVRIECDDCTLHEGDYLFGMIANSASVAGFSFPDKKKVQLDDGVFEVLLVHYPQNLVELGELSTALLSGNTKSPLLSILRISEASFSFASPTSFTLDGEFGGSHTNVDIIVKNKALQIRI